MAVALKGYNQCVYGSGGDEEITLDVAADFKHSARVTSTKVFRSMAGLHKLHPVGP
jgi:hypothetical protein